MKPEQFKIKLAELKAKVEQEAKDIDLTQWEYKLCIVRTGEAPDGSCEYNNEGCLNRAAWIGENSAILISEIHKLRQQRAILATLVSRGISNLSDRRNSSWWTIWKRDAVRDLRHTTKGI